MAQDKVSSYYGSPRDARDQNKNFYGFNEDIFVL